MTEIGPESGTVEVPPEWADALGSTRITLDRTNLLRLIEVNRQHAPSAEHVMTKAPAVGAVGAECFHDGYLAALEGLAAIAEEMPDLYGDTGYPMLRSGEEALEQCCEVLHDAYEAAAAEEGWETQERSRKPWAEVPEANKATMRKAVAVLLEALGLVRE